MDWTYWLPLIWSAVIATGVLMYVLLDGFDLGVGILFRAAPCDRDRDVMMNSIAPFWDGNETWLVLGGGGLFAAFPMAYAIVMPALYMPVLLMLIALIFRGVAFEFRFKADPEHRGKWDQAFMWGSLFAAFAQGLILGGLVQGIEVEGRAFAGGSWDWLTPFSIMTGVALVCGYALLGATWLIIKTEGALQEWACRLTMPLLYTILAFMGAVSLWMPVLHSDMLVVGAGFNEYLQTQIFQRWFSVPNIFFLLPIPVAVVLLSGLTQKALQQRWGTIWEYVPFLCSAGLFILGYIGLAVSLWPKIVPPGVTIWQAAAVPMSQGLLLVGVVILLPIVLAYTGYVYWVFRGKADAAAGYH